MAADGMLAEPSAAEFVPTFAVQPGGATTWAEPGATGVALDPGLPVQLRERRGDWARILCANGWEAWVEGSALVPLAVEASPEEDELYRTLSDALARYQEVAKEAAAGTISADD